MSNKYTVEYTTKTGKTFVFWTGNKDEFDAELKRLAKKGHTINKTTMPKA